MHFHLHNAVALTGLTATACHVKREATWAIAPLTCGIGLGHQLAYVGEHTGIGGRVRPGRAPNGRLVHVDDLVNQLHAHHLIAGGGFVTGAVEVFGQAGVKRLINQGGLAGARYPRDASEQAERELNGYVL